MRFVQFAKEKFTLHTKMRLKVLFFSNAKLSGANLSGANLSQANLSEDDQKMKHFGTDTYKTYQVKQFIRKFLVILVLGVIVQYFVSLEN